MSNIIKHQQWCSLYKSTNSRWHANF